MARTTIEVDDQLIERAMRLTNARAIRRLEGRLDWRGHIAGRRAARGSRR